MSLEVATSLAAQVGASALTGLLMGGSHCIGMCGPLVASFGLSAGARSRPGTGSGTGTGTGSGTGTGTGSGTGAGPALGPGAGSASGAALRAAAGQFPYHLGRITTYGAIGAVMGATGAFVNVAGRLAGLGEIMALLAGALMVALGLGAAGVSDLLRQLEATASRRLMLLIRPLLQGGASRLYPLGLALGLLPCGVSWTIFLGAAASGGPVPGLLMALAFGLGTMPGLLLVGAASALLGQRARGALRRAGGLTVAALGVLFILRGLGVHVPV